jgi:Secretion system C-terminal sorting domain/Concanavalin A-like lectin/glucanases superfamily
MALTIVPDTRPLTIGGDFPGAPEYFNGKIDEVALYARALSDADIAELYSVATHVEGSVAAEAFSLGSPFPNPTQDQVRIDCRLAAPEFVRLGVYDVAGRLIARVAEGNMESGQHAFQWSSEGTGSGIYFLQLEAAGQKRVAKVVVSR